jgi:hypothetical protein
MIDIYIYMCIMYIEIAKKSAPQQELRGFTLVRPTPPHTSTAMLLDKCRKHALWYRTAPLLPYLTV